MGRTRGWSGRRNKKENNDKNDNKHNNNNNNKPGDAVQPMTNLTHRDLHTSFRDPPHSDSKNSLRMVSNIY